MNTDTHAGTEGEVVVVGAGIVGLCVATSLQRDGRSVVLVDPGGPGEGASSGNAGGLSAGSVVPVSAPGVLKNVPRWLRDPLGPLTIRWRYLPQIMPWLIRFVRAGRADRVEAQARALRDLLGPVMTAYAPIAEAAGATHLVHHRGHLSIYRSRAGLADDMGAWELRRRHGVPVEELGAEEMRQLVPELARDYTHGMLIPENGHCSDPLELSRLIAAALEAGGARFVRAKAQDFAIERRRVVAVRTSEGEIEADAVVLSAGAWSRPLAKTLGDDVPLETERGYHVMIPDAGVAPRLPVMAGEDKAAITAMEGGLRIAGTVELAGLHAPANWERARKLVTIGRRIFPALPEMPEERLSMWMGHRPSLPDSLPVIGPSRAAANAFHAYGHGHVGLTAAAMTGKLVADLVAGRTPPIDLTPFRADRF